MSGFGAIGHPSDDGADGIDGAGVDAVAEGPKIPKRGKSAIAGLPAVK